MSFAALVFALHHWYAYHVNGQWESIMVSFDYAKYRILCKLRIIK